MAALSGDWRDEISIEERRGLISDMYDELLRITGTSDKEKAWRSAANFELKAWVESTDETTYLSTIQKKLASLKKKVLSYKPLGF